MPAPLIVQVTETATGGVGRHVRDLLTGLDPARFRQCAVVSYRRTPSGWEAGLPWPVHRLDFRRTLDPLHDWTAYRRLLGLIRELRPDLVHAHSSKAGFLARLAAGRLGIPAVYTPHVFAFQTTAGFRRSLYASLERRAARWGCRLIAVSEAERRAALEERLCPADRLVLLPNGIRPEDYLPPPHPSSRLALGLPAEGELLLALGEFRTQKDYPLLFSALALLEDRPHLHCAVAGLGTDRAAARSLANRLGVADRVLLLGHRADAPALLQATDLFVMTSRCEGCPYALLEAMAAGRPVVAVSAPGVDEIARPDVAFVVPDRRPESLAACLSQALDQTLLSRERAARAREVVAERFTLDRMLAETATVYDQCLSLSS